MKELKIENLKCPHCGELNGIVGKMPRDLGMVSYPTKCWNGGAVQKGCEKDFIVHMITRVYITKTESQVKEEIKLMGDVPPIEKEVQPAL